MTLFQIYKEVCRILNIQRIYKSSDLKDDNMGERLIISLKSYGAEKYDDELNAVSDTYFKLLGHIDENIIQKNIENFGFYIYHNKPKLILDMNTILSVIYISKYNEFYDSEQMFLDSLKFLFKSKN